MSASGGPGFDEWLNSQFQQHAAAHTGPSPLPAQAQYHSAYLKGSRQLSLLATIGAVLSTKAAIGVAAGALVVGAAGAGESVITGSIKPSDWGQQVVKQVNTCKTALTPGSHGIGDCVSSFASRHGKDVSAERHATPTLGHGVHTPGPPADKVNPSPHPRASANPPHNKKK